MSTSVNEAEVPRPMSGGIVWVSFNRIEAAKDGTEEGVREQD